jgi:DNA gyrase subunit A
VSAHLVTDDDEVMLITDGGTLIRTRVKEISVVGRNTRGVRVINLHEEESLIGVGKVDDTGDEGNNGNDVSVQTEQGIESTDEPVDDSDDEE